MLHVEEMVAHVLRDSGRRAFDTLAWTLRGLPRMEAEEARTTLIAQHDRIRAHLNGCSMLGRRLRNGEPIQVELDEALAVLRSDFNEHNATESELIRPLLHDSPGWGTVLVDRMLEEHVSEHAAFWELLSGSAEEVAARIDDLVDELDAHMAAEERTFLSPLVLHPDVITRHRRQEPT
jgi:iron-sulfur cluster repair protein YtfE (RIC family)